MTHDVSHLDGQFVLFEGSGCVPADWSVHELGAWVLTTHPTLPAQELLAADGRHIGWLIGHPIDSRGLLVRQPFRCPGTYDNPEEVQSLEELLYNLGGRFACVVLCDRAKRLYLDAGGTLAAVYHIESRAVGSTNSILTWNRQGTLRCRESALGTLEPNQFFPAGLTPDPDIRRLLPNHYLDLHAWRPIRHWPDHALGRVTDDRVHENVKLIAEQIQKHVSAVTQRYHAYMGLTAGRDSRMILACSRWTLRNITFVTFAHNDVNGARDLSASRQLAKHFDLSRQTVRISQPSDEVKKDYLVRTGYAGHWGKARDFYSAARAQLDPERAFLSGFGGEVGRAFYWGRIVDPSRFPDAEELLSLMNLRRDHESKRAMGDWLSEVPVTDTFTLLDLLYLEQRLGCWAAPHLYGVAPFVVNLLPFCHRKIFESMLRLPQEYCQSQHLADDIIRLAWPGLGQFPFQKPFGVRGFVGSGYRRMRALVHERKSARIPRD